MIEDDEGAGVGDGVGDEVGTVNCIVTRCAEGCRVPYVVVVGVLRVALVCSQRAVYVYEWSCPVGYSGLWNSHVAEAYCSAWSCYCEGHCGCCGGWVWCDCDIGQKLLDSYVSFLCDGNYGSVGYYSNYCRCCVGVNPKACSNRVICLNIGEGVR